MLAVAPGAARRSRPAFDGNDYVLADYIGAANEPGDGAQAFLVDMSTPSGVIAAHFHPVDQFQVFVGGEGRIGKHELAPGTVHYTDAYTPYGPIVGGTTGVAFFTLRAQGDVGAHFMPGARSEMRRKAGRNLTAAVELGHTPAQPGVEWLIEEADGVGVTAARLSRGERVEWDQVMDSARGGFVLVLCGHLWVGGELFPELSCMFKAREDRLPEAEAGPLGATLVAMSFPPD